MRLRVGLPGPFSVSVRVRRSTRLRDIERPKLSSTARQTLTNRQLAKQYKREKALY